jgi:hypothetical protein
MKRILNLKILTDTGAKKGGAYIGLIGDGYITFWEINLISE